MAQHFSDMAAYKKKRIPKAVREAVWVKHVGKRYEHKCLTHWCPNTMTVFDFQTSHNIPESKGGSNELDNLFPLCGRCNLSMGSQYSYDSWSTLFKKSPAPFWRRLCNLFRREAKATPAPAFSNPAPTSTNPLGFPHDRVQVV